MAQTVYDWDASSLEAANRDIIQVMGQHLDNFADGIITNAAQRAIIEELESCEAFVNFHKHINEGVVQVDAEFEGIINKRTSVFPLGHEWKVRFTIDADIPPEGSQQKKHIGFEIHIKTKPKQAGHAWCDAVPKGRPCLGTSMDQETTQRRTKTFPNSDEMTYWYTTYKLRKNQ
ncbi:unnamed protein product [Adineta ricciae]|uniref:Uncharacterized protein n=1 Tax=Adineta ricciae TaxID=249248 RepID=A0A816FTY0_ADIRI|nr:unnamed protein product [Adineta ricciae]CAF1666010.1 unnamed protein product [Adineta ricciae]